MRWLHADRSMLVLSYSWLWCVLLLFEGEHALDDTKQALFEKPVPQRNKTSWFFLGFNINGHADLRGVEHGLGVPVGQAEAAAGFGATDFFGLGRAVHAVAR